MNNPFISICIPAFTRVHYLERLVLSIKQQTFLNYEIIITDDSPDDSVKDFVAKAKIDLPIVYVKNNPVAGSPNNWNAAIKLAKGEWIKLMHDDDWFAAPDALQQFADAAKTTNYDFIFSACNNIYTSGKEVNEFLTGWKKEMLEDNSINLFFQNVIGHPSTVMHRKDNTILYDPQFKWVVDIDFYVRYLQKHSRFLYIPHMLLNIGTDNSQLSFSLYKNPKVEIPEYLSMLAKYPSNLLMKHPYIFHCVWNLIKRFKIKNIQMIRDNGYYNLLPDNVEAIISFQKNIPHFVLKQTNWSKILMKRCFSRIKNQDLYK